MIAPHGTSHDEPAPEGTVYVCAACGKTSPTRSGYDGTGKRVAPGRWDSSCFLHAVLCYSPRVDGQPWQAVPT